MVGNMGTEGHHAAEVQRNSRYPADLVALADRVVGIERLRSPDTHAELFSRIAAEGLEMVIERRIKDRSWPGGHYSRQQAKQLKDELSAGLQAYRETSG